MNYSENSLVRIAKRDNNKKRNYLVVDPLQGKHVPVSPSTALQLFRDLAETVKDRYNSERLLVVGFAETATAIGAQTALCLGAAYLQTTREVLPEVDYLFFSEEHSHATEQKLVKTDLDAVIPQIDRILFVEDEVTTGKTILNIIHILEKTYPDQLKFAVASLLNGMDAEALARYQEKNIDLSYLVKTDHSRYPELADRCICDGTFLDCTEGALISASTLRIDHAIDTRRLTDPAAYEAACCQLTRAIKNQTGDLSGKKVLVLGTEECMYPALYVGSALEQDGAIVRSHATTRSPILVGTGEDYPLHCRYQLKSLYDNERTTYLYDIGKYDSVIVVTDAPETACEGTSSLLRALALHNQNILIVRWCKN
ncbi:MAG: phosphoribosyltransferase domain-containing protein [Eubacteriales bacterium]|nr:phosphoribosyltransferase domain-containing protein [Eubacteriales bacterium]